MSGCVQDTADTALIDFELTPRDLGPRPLDGEAPFVDSALRDGLLDVGQPRDATPEFLDSQIGSDGEAAQDAVIDSTVNGDAEMNPMDAALLDATPPILDVAVGMLDAVPEPDAEPAPIPDAEIEPVADSALPPEDTPIIGDGDVQESAVNGNANGGMRFLDTCPEDSVMIGVAGEIRQGTNYIGRIRVLCGRVRVRNNEVTIDAGQELPLRGLFGGPNFRSVCNPGQAVVGYGGRAGALVDQLVMYCAPLLVQVPRITWNVSLPQMPVGGAGGNAFPQQSCLPGKVSVGGRIQAGDALDGFGIRCRSLLLDP